MPTYFGENVEDTSPIYCTGKMSWRAAAFSCPGSGDQDVKELSVYAKTLGGNCDVRLGLYSSGTLICESPTITFSGTSLAWRSATADFSWPTAVKKLTGGSSYVLAFATNTGGDGFQIGYHGGTWGDEKNVTTDYSAGMPSSLPTGSSGSPHHDVRCGVDTAGKGAGSFTRLHPDGLSGRPYSFVAKDAAGQSAYFQQFMKHRFIPDFMGGRN